MFIVGLCKRLSTLVCTSWFDGTVERPKLAPSVIRYTVNVTVEWKLLAVRVR